jgi:hypothetical protein
VFDGLFYARHSLLRLGVEPIMRAAEQTQILDGVLAAERPRHLMMNL